MKFEVQFLTKTLNLVALPSKLSAKMLAELESNQRYTSV